MGPAVTVLNGVYTGHDPILLSRQKNLRPLAETLTTHMGVLVVDSLWVGKIQIPAVTVSDMTTTAVRLMHPPEDARGTLGMAEIGVDR